MFNFFFLLHSFLSFNSSALSTNNEPNNKKTYYIANCTVLDSDFKVVRILQSGGLCLPMQDGSVIATDLQTSIKKLAPDGKVLWIKKGFYHHQLNISTNSNILALRKVQIKKFLYEEVCELDSKTGNDLKVFSTYKAINENYKKFRDFNRIRDNGDQKFELFSTNIEKLHINSISQFENEYIVNEIGKVSFVLNTEFKFSHFANLEVFNFEDYSPAVHDLQKVDANRFIIFKNFNSDQKTQKKTFKIFEFDENKIHFEFPINIQDFVESDFSGGVQKIGDTFLTGFPINNKADSESFVALISNKGFYIKRAIVPFRIQDIKLIPYADFITKNRMK